MRPSALVTMGQGTATSLSGCNHPSRASSTVHTGMPTIPGRRWAFARSRSFITSQTMEKPSLDVIPSICALGSLDFQSLRPSTALHWGFVSFKEPWFAGAGKTYLSTTPSFVIPQSVSLSAPSNTEKVSGESTSGPAISGGKRGSITLIVGSPVAPTR